MKIYGFDFGLHEKYFGLHENIVALSALQITLVILKYFKITDFAAVWIFMPSWLTVAAVIVVYLITSILRVTPSIDEKGKYFNYCSFISHPGIISARKARWCVSRSCNKNGKCKDHIIYREERKDL